MANLTEDESWTDDLYRIETTDPVEGGESGIDNLQAKQLGRRTRALKNFITEAFAPTWIDGVADWELYRLRGVIVGSVALGDGTGAASLDYTELNLWTGDSYLQFNASGARVYGQDYLVLQNGSGRPHLAGGFRVREDSAWDAHPRFEVEISDVVVQASSGTVQIGYMPVHADRRLAVYEFIVLGDQAVFPKSKYAATVTAYVEDIGGIVTILHVDTDIKYATGALAAGAAPTLEVEIDGNAVSLTNTYGSAPSPAVVWSVHKQVRL